MSMSIYGRQWRTIAMTTFVISSLFLVAHFHTTEFRFKFEGGNARKLINYLISDVVSSSTHRKLQWKSIDKPDRFWGDISNCTNSDIQVTQGSSAPLPSGIPTYTAVIINACASGCDISDIHIQCGWFSSARLIDPLIFKRLHYNDCLVNGGRPLKNGQAISFQYANTGMYPLLVSTMSCL